MILQLVMLRLKTVPKGRPWHTFSQISRLPVEILNIIFKNVAEDAQAGGSAFFAFI